MSKIVGAGPLIREVRQKRAKGQAIVETALIFPVLLLLLAGILDLGRLSYYRVTALNAVREGARAAAAYSTTDEQVRTAVREGAPNINFSLITVTPTGPRSSINSGQPVTVTASFNFALFTPVMSQILPNPLSVTQSATMAIF